MLRRNFLLTPCLAWDFEFLEVPFTRINPVTQHFKDVVDTNAHPANARTPAAFAGFDGDAIEQICFQVSS